MQNYCFSLLIWKSTHCLTQPIKLFVLYDSMRWLLDIRPDRICLVESDAMPLYSSDFVTSEVNDTSCQVTFKVTVQLQLIGRLGKQNENIMHHIFGRAYIV